MRVIAGTARSLPLKTVPGMDTRPTTDRIKETLFNMLQLDIPGARFLDLFAGSGGIGIEALSRGAEEAVFVDQARAAVSCIQENLRFTRFTERARVMQSEVRSALARLEGEPPFQVIFMDPPYRCGLEQEVLDVLSRSGLADKHTLIVVEAAKETDFSWLEEMGYTVQKRKEYKTNMHLFIRKNG